MCIYLWRIINILICLSLVSPALADKVVSVHLTKNKKPIQTITLRETDHGLLITPNLIGLPPGLHGMHIHETPSCDDRGNAAHGHYDPEGTGQHLGPYHSGHLGDLPALFVDESGTATLPVLAPHLTENDVAGHALIIHEKGDNYSDTPKPLGGGGARIACGLIN